MVFFPTHAGEPELRPACCHLCGRSPLGIGIGRRGDPKYLCEECLELGKLLCGIRRFDIFEDRALTATIEKAGELVEKNGTDLGEWTEDQVEEFCATIIMAFGDYLREEIKSNAAPF